MSEPDIDSTLRALLIADARMPQELDQLSRLLTDGYARALELEAERHRLARASADVDDADFTERDAALAARVRELRELLAQARHRFGLVPPFGGPTGALPSHRVSS
jgi:hypothetical protein